MNLADYKKIHFAGIGGISMSGLAEILHDGNYIITGSDNSESEITKHLKSVGIKVFIGQKSENVSPDTELFVYTAALKPDNPEIIRAKELGIKIIDRAELLGTMMKNYTYPISVSGTHGKTTTTSMLTEILLRGENPTVTVGGILPSIGGNFRIGGDKYFVAESCEYCDSFLKFHPLSAIILNVEYDHADYFKSIDTLYASFNAFAKKIPKNGFLIINSEIPETEKILDGVSCEIITYGTDNENGWNIRNVSFDERGNGRYSAFLKNNKIFDIELSVPGTHNILNSLAAAALCYKYEIPKEDIISGLKNFKGTNRRFEFKGMVHGITVIDDYAHHPTEIRSALKAAKGFKYNKLWCIFQPHTFSRTKTFLKEFSEAFDDADKILILDIYPARETSDGTIHSKDLVSLIKERGKDVLYVENFEKAAEYLGARCTNGDMLITMGAGDVYLVGEQMLSTLSTELHTR